MGKLVLSRKIGEIICIGDDIEVMVTAIDGDRVRLGVSAPVAVPVFRSELLRDERARPDSKVVRK